MRLFLLATCCLVVTVSANYRARFDKRAFQYTHYHGGNDIQITVYPNDQNAREGRDVTFDCRARSEDNTIYPSVRWTKVGGPLPRSASESNGRLTISSASLSDSGQYVCIASHEGRTVEAYAQLNVQSYGPQELQGTSSFGSGGGGGGRCMADEKTCGNSECVKSDYVCDGEYDCRDRTDESNCPPPRSCEPNEFKCGNSRCVQKMWLCDGDDDCGDNSDESNCGVSRPGDACQPTEYQCRDGRQCVPQSFQCDGTNDCRDGSDEVGCVQPTVVEPPETNKEVPVGSTFKLNCRAVAEPEPYINWRLNWGPVCDPPRCTQTSEGGVGTLTVTDAKEIDQGAYTCEAINVKGRVLATPDCIVRIVNIPAPTIPTRAPAQCNVAGSVDPYPDSRTGQCRCKVNVRGPLCDQCDAGSFYLHEKAPQGCLKCFCSGVTKQCQSSRWYRTKEKLTFTGGDAQGVTISDIHERNVQTNPNYEFGIRGMLTYTGPQDETLYWRLPGRFLGNKITAYGGTMSFEFQYSGSGSHRSDPMVVLKGNEITLVHRPRDRSQIVADRPNTISIDMYETSWEREDGQPVTREHLLMTLADLESFLIRAVHVDNQYSSSLGDVTFEVAVERDTQEGIALEVEDCDCPPGYIGLSCEDCAPGYERSGGGLYLGTCVPQTAAQCSAGAVSPTAGPSGRCQCKAYVTGPNCDQCIANSFHFSADNPQGCIPCFCSGVTQDCSSSSWYRQTESIDFSRGGRDVFEVTTSDARSPYSPTSRASIGSRELTFSNFGDARGQTLYWKLSDQFLGNKVTTYGGYIKYVFRFSGTGSPNSEPDVILRGNDITLHYVHRDQHRADQENSVEITMFEDRWQRVDGQPATREHLLMTLADLDAFLIKMSYVDRTESSSLLRVEMQYAGERDSGLARALAVEMCRCPPGYVGTSCEDCAPGYSRSGGGLYLGLCERCECHGHATECDLEYGYCIDCQHNTEGDQCERCKPGFTGDARRGTPNDCQSVRVPVPCICYNHSPRGCDSHGRCLLCEHNTEGEHCENCKRGFYGRATDGTPYDCTPCPCPGASECYLDSHGEVTCRNCPAGFSGKLCDECAPGYTEDHTDPSRKCKPIGPIRVQILSPKSISVPIGQTARWQCDIVGDRPPAYNLVWTKVGAVSLPPNARDQNGVLTITNVQESDVGQYRCTATTPHHIATDDGELHIREPQGEPPRPIADPAFQTVNVGDPVRFQCTSSGTPPPTITWGYRYAGGRLRGDITDSNGVLSIPSAQMSDAGEYICTASNPFGTVNAAPVRLDVAAQEVPPTARVEPRVWNGQPGETHEFRCITTGNPPPHITWSGPDGGRLPADVEDVGNGVLRLSNARQDMNGDYECRAVNVAGEASDSGTANIGPSLMIRTTPAGPRIRLTVGEPLRVKCEAIGSPEPTVEWIHDPGPERGDLPDDFVPVAFDDIYITHPAVGLGNTGVYTCRGSNSQATASKDIYLEVIPLSAVATVSILKGNTQTFPVGQSAELICTATGSQLVDRVQWVRLGNSLPYNAKQTDGILRFDTFEASYAGDYECQGYRGTDLIGTASVQISARGGGGPGGLQRPSGAVVRIDDPSVRVIQEGGSIVLKCEVSEHKGKKVNYEWALLREGTMTRLQSTEPTLTIDNANPSTDFGVYRCEVETADEGELLGSAKTAVVIGHSSESNAVSSPFDLKATAQLICPIYTVPGATVTWSRNHGDPLPSKAVEKNNILEIPDFDEEDQGIYTCRVTINHDSVQGFVKASIWVPDTIIQVLTEVSQESLNLGDNAWFDCKVQGDPTATVTWSKEGSDLLPDNSEVKGNRLKLTSLREDNSGIYKCRAQTKAGPLETRTVLNIGSAKRKRKELRNGEALMRNHRHMAGHLEAQKHSNSVFGNWFDSE